MSVARAYAQALFQATRESKENLISLDSIETELDNFSKTLKGSKPMHIALTAPITSSREKVQVVNDLSSRSKVSPIFRSFLTLIARKGRIGQLAEIKEAFRVVRIESEGGLVGQIISPEPLNSEDLEELTQSFSKKLNRKVVFTSTVDAELLAGVKVVVAGITYDGTLRSQLQQLKDRLIYTSVSTH